MEKTFEINGKKVVILRDTYNYNGRLALLAFCADGEEAGELYADLTINLPQLSCDTNEGFLSADTENASVLLKKWGFGKPLRKIRYNWGEYDMFAFNKEAVERLTYTDNELREAFEAECA